MKILVAEDDPVTQKILEATLIQLQHEVLLANDGLEAWNLFVNQPVRIILSDWVMPHLNGLEFCQKVRQQASQDYTYFILLTAIHKEKADFRQAMDAGVDDFLIKPLDFEAVWMRLRVAERIVGFTTQIWQLKSLLPICMYCKKIRSDQDYWQQIETYIHTHTGTDFSHTICPDCFQSQVQPQLDELKRKINPK